MEKKIHCQEIAENTALVKELFEHKWFIEQVELYIWKSGRVAGLDNCTLLKLLSAYFSDAQEKTISELKDEFNTWYQDAFGKYSK